MYITEKPFHRFVQNQNIEARATQYCLLSRDTADEECVGQQRRGPDGTARLEVQQGAGEWAGGGARAPGPGPQQPARPPPSRVKIHVDLLFAACF